MQFTEFKVKQLEPMKKATNEDVQEFLEKHAITIANWMMDREVKPSIVPFVHARQVGLNYNIVVSVENGSKPAIIINPEFTVLDKKYVKNGIQLSESFKKAEHVKTPFMTTRSEKILLKYDEFTSVDEPMTRSSDEYEGELAVMLQEMCDFSGGKLINRFPEIVDEEEVESDTVEGEVID